MKRKGIYISFTNEVTGGGSGSGEENVTMKKSDLAKLESDASKANEFLKQSEEKGKKITELKQALDNLEAQKEEYRTRFEGLESSVRAEYLDKLPEEHRSIAALIPTIAGLAEYVKLNNRNPAGSDSARPGNSGKEFPNAKWDELSYNEKEEIRKKRPELWKKIYRDKFGHNP
jgi:hypothetical protein